MRYIVSKANEFCEVCKGKEIVLFGASSAARQFLLSYDVYDQIKIILDNDKNKNNTKYRIKEYEFDVCLPEKIKTISMQNTIIVITSTYYREIFQQLNEMKELDNVDCYIYLLFEHENYCDLVKINSNKKIMICIGAVTVNRGSEALVESLARECKNVCESIDIYLSSSETDFSPKFTVDYVDYYIKQTNNGVDLLDSFLDAISQMDLIIVVGADNYTKEYNMADKLNSLIKTIKENTNAKMMMYDLSIDESVISDDIKNILNSFDYITARENISYSILKKKLNRKVENIPDPAFLLEVGAIKGEIVEFFNKYEIVGLNLSELVISGKYTVNKEKTIEEYFKLIDYILTKSKYGIVLIPHVMNGCDLYALKLLYEKYKNEERVKLIDNEELRAKELKAIIAKCRFYIGARTHTIIAAYSKLVPAITVAYSVKAYGIAEDLFGTDADKFVLDIRNGLKEDSLIEAFQYMVANEKEIKELLGKAVPKYVNNARKISILLNHIINNKYSNGCCGCQACVQICPKKCIQMEYDEEGFLYPVIDYANCIACRKCISVCPVENVYYNKNVSDEEYYCAFSKETGLMEKSSSGGLFSLIAEEILKEGGVVYGAETIDGIDVFHSREESVEGYKKFRKSKYLQSDINETYLQARSDLEKGRNVLFSGTPCQIGGLYSFLGVDYDNLYTLDLTCHGVPSKAVYRKYKSEIEKIYNVEVSKIVWRNKEKGWKPNYLEIQFEDGERILEISDCNGFARGFLNNLFLRKSCYDCKYNRISRVADITLGDYFGYEGLMINGNQNKGLSLLVLSTMKAKELFKKIQSDIIYEKSSCEYAKEKNYHLANPPFYNMKREKFFKDFISGIAYDELAKDYLDIDISGSKKE